MAPSPIALPFTTPACFPLPFLHGVRSLTPETFHHGLALHPPLSANTLRSQSPCTKAILTKYEPTFDRLALPHPAGNNQPPTIILKFLVPSVLGNQYILAVYEYDSNYIHAEPMVDRTGPSIIDAYQRSITFLQSRGFKPLLQRLDNEATRALQDFLVASDIDFQLAPPHIHQRNAAERAIRTFKNHFIAGLCSTNPAFPLNMWDKLLPQCLVTLNLLRQSRINPQLSAQAHINGSFDFNRTPLAPPGTKVLIHEKPSTRGTWAPHAVEGWYLGPAQRHYRCYRVWAWATNSERIADTLAWFPTTVIMPHNSLTDVTIAAAHDLAQALL
jgi:hypothetical protein